MKPQRTDVLPRSDSLCHHPKLSQKPNNPDVFADVQVIILGQPCWSQLAFGYKTKKILLSDDVISGAWFSVKGSDQIVFNLKRYLKLIYHKQIDLILQDALGCAYI